MASEKLTPQEERELDQLIEKFKSDDEYFAHIQRQATSHILTRKITSTQKPTAEQRLLDLVVKYRC
jgi:urease accessory protein UreH